MKKKSEPIKVIVEYTEGYEDRFTMAILKIYENRVKNGYYDGKVNGQQEIG